MSPQLKNILLFGAGMGLVMVLIVSLSIAGEGNGLDYFVAEVIGYATMFLGLGVGVFLVLRKEREKGSLGFGRAFGMGMGVSTVAGIVFGIYTVLLYGVFMPDLFERMMEMMEKSMLEAGKSAEEVAAAQAQYTSQPDWMMSPAFQGLLMMVTVIMVGVLVSLAMAAIMREKTPTS